ncbi:MAG: hypothetical protein F6K17_25885, partial [Okeania sp. SIO3C4]|nr:hypothetical protein [Okeania sp. SIO3C4]
NSTAPISTPAPANRCSPRWSVVSKLGLLPASMAGLLARGKWVKVGPPLSARSPSRGSVMPTWSRSPSKTSMTLPVPIRLLPPLVKLSFLRKSISISTSVLTLPETMLEVTLVEIGEIG